MNEPGKGRYWTLDILTNPHGLKRERKRRQKGSKKAESARDEDDDYEYSDERGNSEDDDLEQGVSSMQPFPKTFAPPPNLATQYAMNQRNLQNWGSPSTSSQSARHPTYRLPPPHSTSDLLHQAKVGSISPPPQPEPRGRMYHSVSTPFPMSQARSYASSIQVVPSPQPNFNNSNAFPTTEHIPLSAPSQFGGHPSGSITSRHGSPVKQEDEALASAKPPRRSTRDRKGKERA